MKEFFKHHWVVAAVVILVIFLAVRHWLGADSGKSSRLTHIPADQVAAGDTRYTYRLIQPDTSIGILCEYNKKLSARDGVMLEYDIFRPDKEGKYQVIIALAPYVRDSGEMNMLGVEDRVSNGRRRSPGVPARLVDPYRDILYRSGMRTGFGTIFMMDRLKREAMFKNSYMLMLFRHRLLDDTWPGRGNQDMRCAS
jgi:hypothetical protein